MSKLPPNVRRPGLYGLGAASAASSCCTRKIGQTSLRPRQPAPKLIGRPVYKPKGPR